MIQDAGWGWGPASNGKTLFTGPAQSRCEFSGERSHLPGDGGTVWSECGQRGEVVAALARQWQCCGQADGRAPAAAADGGGRVAVGADRREAGPDLAGSGDRTAERGTPASYGAVWRFFKHEGITFKKHCTPANRIAPTSPVAGSGGRHIRADLTRGAWCSLTRPPLSLGQALGQDQYDPPLRALPARRSLDRQIRRRFRSCDQLRSPRYLATERVSAGWSWTGGRCRGAIGDRVWPARRSGR